MKEGAFAYSFESYSSGAEICRRVLREIKNANRVEMMVGSPDLPYPFTCVIETDDMDALDKELVEWHRHVPRPDEIGLRDTDMLLDEGQSLLRKETWVSPFYGGEPFKIYWW